MENRKRRKGLIRTRWCARGLKRNMRAELKALVGLFDEVIENWKLKPLTTLATTAMAALLGWGVVRLYLLYPINDGGDLAAWVQAIGAILAVAGGIYASRSDLRARNRLEQRRKQRAESKITLIAKRLQHLAEELKSESEQATPSSSRDYFKFQVPVSSVQELLDLLSGCDLESLDDSDFFLRVADLREAAHSLVCAMRYAQDQYREFQCVPHDGPRGHTDLVSYIENIVKSLESGR